MQLMLFHTQIVCTISIQGLNIILMKADKV